MAHVNLGGWGEDHDEEQEEYYAAPGFDNAYYDEAAEPPPPPPQPQPQQQQNAVVEVPSESTYVGVDEIRAETRRRRAEFAAARRANVRRLDAMERMAREVDREAQGGDTELRRVTDTFAADLDYCTSCSDDEEVLQYTIRALRRELRAKTRRHHGRLAAVPRPRQRRRPARAAAGGDDDDEESFFFSDESAHDDDASSREPSDMSDVTARSEVLASASSSSSRRRRRRKRDDEPAPPPPPPGDFADDEEEDDAILRHEQSVQQSRVAIAHLRAVLKKPADNPCFCCDYAGGDAAHNDALEPAINQCFRYMERKVGTAPIRSVARAVHKFFKQRVYLPAQREGRYVPMWRTADIQAHLETHEKEPRVVLHQRIAEMDDLITSFANGIHERDEHGRLTTNYRNALVYERFLKLRMQLATTDYTKMIGYRAESAYNLSAGQPRTSAIVSRIK